MDAIASIHLNYANETDHRKIAAKEQLNKMRTAMCFSIFVNMASKINSRNLQLCTSFPSNILCT
jgi:hypothetical protein